jgi:hypothetical protein
MAGRAFDAKGGMSELVRFYTENKVVVGDGTQVNKCSI